MKTPANSNALARLSSLRHLEAKEAFSISRLAVACASVLALAVSTGCPAPAGPDGGDDGGIVDGGLTDGGAGDDDGGRPSDGGTDAGPPPVLDAGPDDSLANTPFADIAIRWERDLELCNAWVEGGALGSERTRKVRVRIPRQPRATLGETHLGQSSVDGVFLERGVNAAERNNDAAALTSTLTEWSVTEPSGNTSWWDLTAAISHDLGNDAGTLIERYSVQRTAEDADRDIVIGDQFGFGYSFSFVPPGGADEDAIFLTSCEPTEQTHLVVEALVGSIEEGPHAGRLFQVTRYARSYDVFAGSYPVYWDASDIFFTDEPYAGITVHGFWPQTYSAAHHNWDEASVIEPRLDVGAYFNFFDALDAGNGRSLDTFSKVEWRNVTNFAEPGSLDVTTQNLETGVETIHEVRLLSAFRPMSTHVLEREATQTCADAEVKAIGSYAYSGVSGDAFQLMMCPNESALGFDLLGVVPLASSVDGSVAGTMINGAAISSVDDGFVVQVGAGSLRIFPLENSSDFGFEVLDADGESILSSLAQPRTLEAPVPQDDVIEGRAEGVRFKLVRRVAAPGVGESVIYAPRLLEVTIDDESFTIDGFDQFDYSNSHHNWNDAMVATDGDFELRWNVSFSEGVLTHTISASSVGEPILADTVLEVD